MVGIIFGAGGNSDGINWIEIAALWGNFFILLLVLPKIIRSLTGRSPKEHLKNQRDEMAAQLKEAQDKQALAEARLLEYATKLGNLEKSIAEV